MSNGRKTQGRQKIEIKKMTNESNMLVTFSKRRSGLFKKASELSTLCGAEVSLILFSPGGKVFSFGHPNVDTVIDRYLSRVPYENNVTTQFIEAQRSANLCELNSQLTRINNALDIEKKRIDEFKYMFKSCETQYWWACPVDGMNYTQLGLLKNASEGLKKRIVELANRHVIQGLPTQTVPVFVGNNSFSNMPIQHQPNPQQIQLFPQQPFQNHMLQDHLFGVNNMGAGGYGPPRFF
jgi:hypothetical protein